MEPEPSAVAQQKKTPSPLLPSLPWIRRKAGENPANERKLSLPWLSPPNARISATSNEESEFVVVEVSKKSPAQSITWVIGTVVFVSGSLLNFASYAYAAQSMLASLESIQFVTNLIFGRFMLKAHVVRDWMSASSQNSCILNPYLTSSAQLV